MERKRGFVTSYSKFDERDNLPSILLYQRKQDANVYSDDSGSIEMVELRPGDIIVNAGDVVRGLEKIGHGVVVDLLTRKEPAFEPREEG